MHLLQFGERTAGIALWLGHESSTTTHQLTDASLAVNQRALAKLQDTDTAAKRFSATYLLLKSRRRWNHKKSTSALSASRTN